MLPALQEPGRLLLAGLGVPAGPGGRLSHRVLTVRADHGGPAGPVPCVVAASHETTGVNKCSAVLSRAATTWNISDCAGRVVLTDSINLAQAGLI